MSNGTSGLESDCASTDTVLVQLRTSPPPKERADAARNRAALLAAAAELFARHGVGNVSMDAIAEAAEVGKGTLFRRFGDKAGLAVALLDERERKLQDAILSGPPPLGPGDADGPTPSPHERLSAFVDAYLDYVVTHLDLVHMSETATPGARYRIGAYRFWHRHVTNLARAAGSADPEALAHALLAPLAAEHLRAVLDEQDFDRVRRATRAPVDAIA